MLVIVIEALYKNIFIERGYGRIYVWIVLEDILEGGTEHTYIKPMSILLLQTFYYRGQHYIVPQKVKGAEKQFLFPG